MRRARHERRPGSPQEPLHAVPVGRRAAPGPAVDRGRARDPRRRARILPGQAVPARDRGEPAREVPSRDHERDGRDGLPRRHAGRLRLRRRELRQLRPDRARGGAGRFRLPLGVLRAVVAGDVSDLGFRLRGAEAKISAEAAQRRMGRLLRPDRTRRRLRSGLDAHAGQEGRWRLRAERLEDLDHQRGDRRRVRGLGEGRCGRHPRLHPREGHEGPERSRRSRANSRCARRSPA